MATPTFPASMCLLTCGKCGHQDDWEAFQFAPITGQLPAGTYQCPACRRAWQMQPQDRGRFYPSGLYVPPTLKATTIPTIL